MRRLCRRIGGVRMLVLLLALVAARLHAEDEPWALLKKGGHVVLVRHAQTTDGIGDPPGMRLDDCATQRNLSEAGRAQARRLGEEFRQFRIPVDEVLSSEWCRDELAARIAQWRGKGNLVLVTHGSTILALTRVGAQMGEMLILAPLGTNEGDGRFAVVSRLSVP